MRYGNDTMTTCEAANCMLYGKPQHKITMCHVWMQDVQILSNSHPVRMLHFTM